MSEVHRSFCRFCIALCGVTVSTDGDSVVGVTGNPEHPASRGYTCAKGRALGRWHHHPDRILDPRVRRGGEWGSVAWTDALADVGALVRRSLASAGPDSVGAYIGTAASLDAAGKWAAERFVRAVGSRSKYSAISIDNPCKPLVSLLMSGQANLVPVVDDRRCTLAAFVGCNPVVSHGHLNGFPDPVVRLREMATPPRELWVIDSRRTESARLATRWLQPRPGTDFAIVAHVVRALLVDGGADLDHLSRHADETEVCLLGELLAEWTTDHTSAITGCPVGDLDDFVSAVRRHGRLAMQTGTGATMAAVANLTEWLVWVLHVVTGSYDAEGGMWFNPGFLHRNDVAAVARHAPPTPSPGPRSRPELATWGDEYPCAALADEIEAGNLRVLVVFGGNPVSAFPDPARTRRALAELDALVVVDVVETDTTRIATHVLPAHGQLERADLPYFYDQFNLDHSTQYTPAIVPPLGRSRSMWAIAAALAEGVGAPILPPPLSSESRDEDVLAHMAVGAAAPFDEIVRERYLASAPTFGWVHRRVLPDGRWRLVPGELVAQLRRWRELVPPAGLLATSRRQHRQLNSQHPPSPSDGPAQAFAVLHPATAARRGVEDGSVIVVRSAHGELRLTAAYSVDIHPDGVSIPHGWTDENVSHLTSADRVDDLTGMVVQTAIPVEVLPGGGA